MARRPHSRFERTYADETPLATSFRVYTPAEIRTSRLRPSVVPPPVAEKMTPEALAKSIGIAFGAIVAVFIAFLVIGNLTDDTSNPNRTGLAQARLGGGVGATHALAAAPPPVAPIAAPVEALPMQVVGDPPTDFELPDETPVRTAAKPKKKKRKPAP